MLGLAYIASRLLNVNAMIDQKLILYIIRSWRICVEKHKLRFEAIFTVFTLCKYMVFGSGSDVCVEWVDWNFFYGNL